MTLKLVPPPKRKDDHTEPPDLSTNVRIGIIIFILLIIPLAIFEYVKTDWGLEMATHAGFFTGVFCVFIASGLIYFSGFLDDKGDKK